MITSAATALTFGISRGIGVIWLDSVQCEGNESRLIDCPANQLGFSDCTHFRDVGVTCSETNCTHGDIRLQGNLPNKGRVEICVNNIWGKVCIDSWYNPDAEVACRQLGLQYTSTYIRRTHMSQNLDSKLDTDFFFVLAGSKIYYSFFLYCEY